MRAIATLAAAAAMLALAGCDRLGIGSGGEAANGSANGSANASADAGKDPAANAAEAAGGGKDPAGGAIPAAAGGITLNRDYVAGRWTDNGDCSVAVDFGLDGRFTANNGAGGLWNLDGDRLTMSGSSTLTLQIVPIDQDTMNVVNPDGSLGRSTRC
jgi:hypothetical protein